jgi:hypothetical protein
MFQKSLHVVKDGEMIRVTYTAPDPETARAATGAIIDAFQQLARDIDPENPAWKQARLEELKDGYEKKLDVARKYIADLAHPYPPELLESRLVYLAAESNTQETAWKRAREALEDWIAMHPADAVSPVAPISAAPTPGGPFEQLSARERAARKRFDEASTEMTALAQKVTTIHDISETEKPVREWLDETKQALERLRVQLNGTGRMLMVSMGDRPVYHSHGREAALAGVAVGVLTLGIGGIWAQRGGRKAVALPSPGVDG